MNKLNNRIRELIKLHGSDSSGKWVAVDKVELIAEIIIKECAEVFWSEACNMSDLAYEEYYRNSKKIKKHFGVEK